MRIVALSLALSLAGACSASTLPSNWGCVAPPAQYEERRFATSGSNSKVAGLVSFAAQSPDLTYSPVASFFFHGALDGTAVARFKRIGVQIGVIPTDPRRLTIFLVTPGERAELGKAKLTETIKVEMTAVANRFSIAAGGMRRTFSVADFSLDGGSVSCSSASVQFSGLSAKMAF